MAEFQTIADRSQFAERADIDPVLFDDLQRLFANLLLAKTWIAGDLLVGLANGIKQLPRGTENQVLAIFEGSVEWRTAAAASAHAILSATHTDSVAAAVTAEALIHGNVTPAWAKTIDLLFNDTTDLLRVRNAGADTHNINAQGKTQFNVALADIDHGINGDTITDVLGVDAGADAALMLGGRRVRVTQITDVNLTLTAGHYSVFATRTGGMPTVTVTLPSPHTEGQEHEIKNVGTLIVVLDPNGNNIDGAGSNMNIAANSNLKVRSDGTDWETV